MTDHLPLKKKMSVVVALLLACAVGACKRDVPDNTGDTSDIDNAFEVWVKAKGGKVNEINAKINEENETLTHLAAQEGCVDVLDWLKQRGANVNARDRNGWVPMHSAALENRIAVMKWLKEQGVDVNVRNQNGWTPMHVAALEGHVAAMKWLREQGVDVNVKDDHGNTPMQVATKAGRTAVVKWLKEQGVDINARDNEGRTPLFYAHKPEAKEWLLANGAE